jgi:capsule polysaccharide export protein KpsE/RkpR
MDIMKDLQLTSEERCLATASLDGNDRRWVSVASLLWEKRRRILRVTAVALIVSTAVAFLLPKQYESTARIMPPDPQGGGATALLAALSGKAMPGGAMGALAGGLLGLKNTGALFVDLLQSRSVQEHLVDQFDLQKVYSTRYRQDAMKRLFHHTDITEDRKSGVITIVVTDTDRRRARDLTQAYLDQLDSLLARVNTSAARRERQFIEQRLVTVQSDLERAQLELSDFSSKNTALDIREQTRAMVEAGAKLQGQLIVGRSELDSLEQIYGSENVRVRAARARVADLQRELQRMIGSSESVGIKEKGNGDDLYPPLRQLPVLGVRWADLYRRVKIEETVYDLLNEEYETARIEEAKAIPTVSVIDSPNWPEKKSFPPRRLIVIGCTLVTTFLASFSLLMRERWSTIARHDPRKQLARTIWLTIRNDSLRLYRR